MQKILYISHVSLTKSHYGAASSGRAHEQVLKDTSFEIDYVEQSLDGNIFKKASYNINARAIPLPVAPIYWGRKKNSFAKKTLNILRQYIGCLSFLFFILKKRNKYSIIHLGSITLLPLAPIIKFLMPTAKIILHSREVLNKYSTKINNCIQCLDHVIFIDKYCQLQFSQLHKYPIKSSVVTNPLPRRVPGQKIRLDRAQLNLGLIGNFFDSSKGIDGISELKHIAVPFTLHIFGKIPHKNNLDLEQLTTNITVVCHNEVSDLYFSNVYDDLDYVVRLDPTYRVGRTVIEAVASGCQILANNNLSNELEFNGALTTFNELEKNGGYLKKIKFPNKNILPRQAEMINQDYISAIKRIYCT